MREPAAGDDLVQGPEGPIDCYRRLPARSALVSDLAPAVARDAFDVMLPVQGETARRVPRRRMPGREVARIYPFACAASTRKYRMRWQLGQMKTRSRFRWISLKSCGGTCMRQPWQMPPRASTTARPPRREKIIS